MNKQQFEFLLKQGEGLQIEFKENFDSKSLGKEIVAFANTEGGRIFIGVNDKGEPKGVNITNKLKSEIQDLARNCDPSVNINMETVENVLVVNVEEGLALPVFEFTGFFTIIFKRPVTPQATPQAKLTELEEKIVREIKVNSKISRRKLAEKLGVSDDTVKEYLEKLKSKGVLVRIGKTSAGYWEIIEIKKREK